jgi:hypothetical protein
VGKFILCYKKIVTALINIVACLLILMGAVGMFLCLFSFIPLAGYFFGRVILRFMRLHSADSEQIQGEIKLAKICAALLLGTVGCWYMGAWLGSITGIID